MCRLLFRRLVSTLACVCRRFFSQPFFSCSVCTFRSRFLLPPVVRLAMAAVWTPLPPMYYAQVTHRVAVFQLQSEPLWLRHRVRLSSAFLSLCLGMFCFILKEFSSNMFVFIGVPPCPRGVPILPRVKGNIILSIVVSLLRIRSINSIPGMIQVVVSNIWTRFSDLYCDDAVHSCGLMANLEYATIFHPLV